MSNRHRLEANEGAKGRILHAPLDGTAILAKWIGTVERKNADSAPRARTEGQHSGPHERVVASADILQIDEQHVELGQVSGVRREVFDVLTVEATNGDAANVFCIGDADHVLRFASVTVLGAKDDAGL